MRDVLVSELRQTALEQQRMEICERKGLGHPDSICDCMMNEVSVALSKEYLNRFGRIMHHNIDKGLLVAGETKVRLCGGEVLKPMRVVFGDRATFEVDSERVPVDEIAVQIGKDWFRRNMRFVDAEEHVKYQVEIKRGTDALTDIFSRSGRFLGANDTSAAVGYAPLTRTERIVLETERFLNAPAFKKRFPESGEDVKVMALRKDDELNLTIAMAFVDRYIESESTYFRMKSEIKDEIGRFVASRSDFDTINIDMNTADQRNRGIGGMYLTVLGTSADGGDCGQVGRGNRVNGIIPLNRPTCSEAAAGKNPASHVGKIYNLLTYRMAERIYEGVPGIDEVYVWLLSQIGEPIDRPKIASAEVILKPRVQLSSVSHQITEMINSELDNVDSFCMSLAEGKIPVC